MRRERAPAMGLGLQSITLDVGSGLGLKLHTDSSAENHHHKSPVGHHVLLVRALLRLDVRAVARSLLTSIHDPQNVHLGLLCTGMVGSANHSSKALSDVLDIAENPSIPAVSRRALV